VQAATALGFIEKIPIIVLSIWNLIWRNNWQRKSHTADCPTDWSAVICSHHDFAGVPRIWK